MAVRWYVLSTGLLTTDDLDEIDHRAFQTDESLSVAAELVDAVERERLADLADSGYALILAAEITEHAGDLPGALVLADRAVAAYRTHHDPDYGYPRAFRAGLLMRLDRDDEAMAELRDLRPLLSRSVNAVLYISETLEEGGRAEIAEEWLASALLAELAHQEMLESQRGQSVDEQADEPDEQADEQMGAVMFTLAQQRHRLRRSHGLPHDTLDQFADLLMNEVQGTLDDDELDDDELDDDELYEEVVEEILVLFWPQAEFDQLLQCWPELAEIYGPNWDAHRADLQRVLVQHSERGYARLGLLTGTVDELAEHATRLGGDPADPQIHDGYMQYVEESPQEIPWPPGRNQTCWCGSGLKYKKCCFRRTRT